jgi:hypothetical protein
MMAAALKFWGSDCMITSSTSMELISDERRIVMIENEWPEFIHKLSPRWWSPVLAGFGANSDAWGANWGGLLALRWRRRSIKKVRESSHELRWREGLCQYDAVGDSFGAPMFGLRAAHVYDGECGIDLPGAVRDFPAVDFAWEIYVRNEGAVFSAMAG